MMLKFISLLISIVSIAFLFSDEPISLCQILVIIPILLSLLLIFFDRLRLFTMPRLRRYPFVFFGLMLFLFAGLFFLWLVTYQPAVAVPLSGQAIIILLGLLWSGLTLPFLGITRAEWLVIDQRIRWRSGVLITLSTVLLMIFLVELGLRYFVVMSDNFAFSKMHQNWFNVYWNPVNELGYRDYPSVAEADLEQVIVLGDSLVSGYGVGDIDQTFPHLLPALTDSDDQVHIVAMPGWGVATALYALQQYPIKPDKLILSHFINDILEGPAGKLYTQPFPQLRITPDENLAWWVENTYIGNFMFYRLYHYGNSHNAEGKYVNHTLNAYSDDIVWPAYVKELQSVVDWAAERDIDLYVIIWPNLVDIESSQLANQKVHQFFVEQDIPVIELSSVFNEMSVQALVVNAFDAHPSVLSHEIAARLLADLLENQP